MGIMRRFIASARRPVAVAQWQDWGFCLILLLEFAGVAWRAGRWVYANTDTIAALIISWIAQ